jgi:hypothetical protein
VHDTTRLDTKRAPAYTDRILYRLPGETADLAGPTTEPSLSPSVPVEHLESATSLLDSVRSVIPDLGGPISVSQDQSISMPDPPVEVPALEASHAHQGSPKAAGLPTPTPSELPDGNSCVTLTYSSHPILWSDHHPVSCTFKLGIRVVDDEKRRTVLLQGRREVERLMSVWRASLGVVGGDVGVEFGEVR